VLSDLWEELEFWEELDQLTRRVRSTFGDAVYEEAMSRAMRAVRQRFRPFDVDAPAEAIAALYAALEIELRRILTNGQQQ
jgi:hypothetical protein